MALAPVTNGSQITVRYTLAGQECVNVLGLYDRNVASATTQAEAQAVLQAWWSAVRTHVSQELVCVGGEFRDLAEVPGQTFELSAPTGGGGSVTGGVALTAAAFRIKWGTSFPGRSGRGVTYLPGVAEGSTNVDGRTLMTTAQSALLSSIQTTYLTALTGGSGPLVPAVISHKVGNARQITSASVLSVIGVQRRRMR